MTDKLIQMPDGSTAAFPSYMSDSDIEAALAGDASAGTKLIQQATGTDISQAGNYDFGKALLSGLTLGHEPEVVGGTKALFAGANYPEAVAGERNAENAYRMVQPAGFGLGQGLGATVPVGGVLAATDMAGGAIFGAPAAAPWLGQAAPLTRPGWMDFVAGQSPGPLGIRMASGATRGAVQGAEAGVMESGMPPDRSGWNEIGPGIVANSLLGALSPAVRETLIPSMAPGVAGIAQSGDRLGVNLTLPQLVQTGKSGVRPGGSTEQLASFTRALSRTMGGDSETLDEPTMLGIRQNLQSGFDALAARTNIPAGEAGLNADLVRLERQAASTYRGNPSALNKVTGQIDNIRDALSAGIPGNAYQEMTSFGGDLQRLSNDSETRLYGVKLRNAVDAAMQRNSTPQDVAAWSDLRSKWKNMVSLQDVVGKAQPSGTVNPRAIDPIVRQSWKDYEFGGGGDLGTLAQVGKLLPPAMATGEAKEPASHSLWSTIRAHPIMGAAGVIGADRLIESPGAATALITDHPVAAALGGLATVGTAGLVAGKRALANSQFWRNIAISHALEPAAAGVPTVLAPGVAYGTNALVPWPTKPQQ